MEMKYVVPDMAQSFGTLEFAGESEPVFERDKNNRRVLARRSFNLYSDVQKGENVVVEIPVQAGEKKFQYEQKVKLVNPKLWCCIIKVDTLFSRILIYNHNQYENRRKTYGTESKIL